jgi:hypothetical protein
MENINQIVEETIKATKMEMLKTHKPFSNFNNNENETLKSFNNLLPKKNELFFNNGKLFEARSTSEIDVKAVVTTAGFNSGATNSQGNFLPMQYPYIGDVAQVQVIGNMNYSYLLKVQEITNALEAVAEGNTVPEIPYTYTPTAGSLYTYPGRINFTRQALIEIMARGLDENHYNILANSVKQSMSKSSLQTITAVISQTAIFDTNGSNLAELCGYGVGTLSDSYVTPDTLFIHPKNYEAFRMTRTSYGYPFLDTKALPTTITKLVVAPYVPIGTALLGDSKELRLFVNDTLVLSGETYVDGTIITGGRNTSDIEKNCYTFVGEIFAKTVLEFPNAFVKITGLPSVASCLAPCVA